MLRESYRESADNAEAEPTQVETADPDLKKLIEKLLLPKNATIEDVKDELGELDSDSKDALPPELDSLIDAIEKDTYGAPRTEKTPAKVEADETESSDPVFALAQLIGDPTLKTPAQILETINSMSDDEFDVLANKPEYTALKAQVETKGKDPRMNSESPFG